MSDELSIGQEPRLRSDERVNGTKPPLQMLATHVPDTKPHGLIVVDDSAVVQSRVCGVSLLARMICALDRAAETVYVLATPACPETALRAVRRELDLRPRKPNVTWITSLASVPGDRGLFILPVTGVFDERVCKRVARVEGYRDKILQFRRSGERPFMWYVGARYTSEVIGQLSGRADAGNLLPALLERQAMEDVDPGRELCDRVSDELSRRSAEERLFAQARKASDTWIARNFDRHVSIWMTRRLVPLPVTPNQVTVIATVLGVIGAGFLAIGTYGAQLFGSILLVLSVVIDGCDGEVARLKYLESDFGRRLDFFLDNVVNTLGIFACSAGHYFQGGPVFYLYASCINAGAALASVLPVYWLFFRENKEAYSPEQVSAPQQGFDATSLAQNIAGRDFVYLIFFLALFGRAYWFAYFCLVGLLAFLVFVVALNVRRWQASRR
jgi:phosphatidylglycerophosphate synthase